MFNGHYDERCFLPIHVYDTATSRPVAMLLRPGATPSGEEVRNHLRRLVRRIRRHWPNTRLTIRGDGHYGRPEVMSWCEGNGVDYILGLPGNKVLDRLVEPVADAVRVRRALSQAPVFRRCAETRYGAKSWRCERRVAARIEVTQKGLDICDEEGPADTGEMDEFGWTCQACLDEAARERAACQHEWEPCIFDDLRLCMSCGMTMPIEKGDAAFPLVCDGWVEPPEA